MFELEQVPGIWRLGEIHFIRYSKRVRNLAVSVYDLIPSTNEQLELLASPTHAVSDAMDEINDKWSEFVITPALMMGMDEVILDRIASGGVKELEELYAE